MKKLSLLLLLFSLASCGVIFHKKVDFDFQPQTNSSLLHYLDSNKVAYTKADLATLKDTASFRSFAVKTKLNMPTAYFFNKDGYRVDDKFNGTSCGHVINNIDKINTAPPITSEHIDSWTKDFTFLEPSDADGKEYDVTIILTWGLFVNKDAPKINEPSFEWYKNLKEDYPNIKIRTILLNMDFQRGWFVAEEAVKEASSENIMQ